jgi:hypothetical protein
VQQRLRISIEKLPHTQGRHIDKEAVIGDVADLALVKYGATQLRHKLADFCRCCGVPCCCSEVPSFNLEPDRRGTMLDSETQSVPKLRAKAIGWTPETGVLQVREDAFPSA